MDELSSHLNLYVEVLSPNMTEFGGKAMWAYGKG